jgi:hypothetical protein
MIVRTLYEYLLLRTDFTRRFPQKLRSTTGFQAKIDDVIRNSCFVLRQMLNVPGVSGIVPET